MDHPGGSHLDCAERSFIGRTASWHCLQAAPLKGSAVTVETCQQERRVSAHCRACLSDPEDVHPVCELLAPRDCSNGDLLWLPNE